MPVHTIRDLNNNNDNPNRGQAPVPPGWGNSSGNGGGRTLGGRTLGGDSSSNTTRQPSTTGRVLGSGEAVSYQPSSANYADGGAIGGGGGFFSGFRNMFSGFGRSNTTPSGGSYTATGQPVDVETGGAATISNDPYQNQYNMNEDMFWSYNLHNIQPQWYHMCLMCCCPCFVGPPCSPVRKQDYKNMLMTFCFWISIVQLIYFIVELSVGGFDPQNPSIGPSSLTLLKLGAKSSYYIKEKYELWRLVVPLIMHAGILHIFMNLFIQIMVCMGYEKNWRWYRVIPIYFISGIAGNLLSCVAMPASISVGASGAIMGLIGAKVSNIIVRWTRIPTQQKVMQCINVGIIIFITLLWSFSDYIDWAGHIGGLVTGFILGFACFAVTEIQDKVYKWTIFSVSVGLTLVTLLTLSLVFGLVTDTSKYAL
ncbi:hypothetical protein FDP41_009181 [Naegleria fowleri]|uniref:rhomboid protease n=1 Tax=Naegleria fowleri TaxID=5763 RepID=A0A6A5BEA9_NAEFO|nr:uncharacterized protein FDP41_009181 [Naegleria fowleri]KAF0972278.1 hypothetical protein FDP41_009181 [Naegleria fowleri]